MGIVPDGMLWACLDPSLVFNKSGLFYLPNLIHVFSFEIDTLISS